MVARSCTWKRRVQCLFIYCLKVGSQFQSFQFHGSDGHSNCCIGPIPPIQTIQFLIGYSCEATVMTLLSRRRRIKLNQFLTHWNNMTDSISISTTQGNSPEARQESTVKLVVSAECALKFSFHFQPNARIHLTRTAADVSSLGQWWKEPKPKELPVRTLGESRPGRHIHASQPVWPKDKALG